MPEKRLHIFVECTFRPMLVLFLLLLLCAHCIDAGSSPRNRRTPLGEFRINKAKASKMFTKPLTGPQFEAEKRERIEEMVANAKQSAEVLAKKREKEVERRKSKIAKAKERKAAISYKALSKVVQPKRVQQLNDDDDNEKEGKHEEDEEDEEEEEERYLRSVSPVRVAGSPSLDIDTRKLMEKKTRVSNSTGGMSRLRTLIRSKKNKK